MGNVLRFFLARATPALFGFLAIAVYTRLLSREEFGVYSVTLAGANAVAALLFHWLGLSLVRFCFAEGRDRSAYQATILALYGTVAGVCSALLLVVLVWSESLLGSSMAVGAAIVVFESWLMLNQRLSIALVQPLRLAMMTTTKVVVGLSGGAWAASAGFGSTGVLLGVLVGTICGGLIPSNLTSWQHLSLSAVTARHVADIWRYGAPLGVTVALGFALSVVDRALLTLFHGPEPAGEFAASFDLTNAAVTLAATTVNIATFPQLLATAEQGDHQTTRSRFRANLHLLILVSVPVVMAMVVLAENVGRVVLGSEFHDAAPSVIAWIAIAAFLGCTRSFYFDVVFHVAKDTRTILRIVAGVLIVNALLNAALIPTYGIDGAVCAAVVAQIVGVASSAWYGRGRGLLPGLDIESLKLVGAGLIAGLGAALLSDMQGTSALAIQMMALVTTYGASLLVLRTQLAMRALRAIRPLWRSRRTALDADG